MVGESSETRFPGARTPPLSTSFYISGIYLWRFFVQPQVSEQVLCPVTCSRTLWYGTSLLWRRNMRPGLETFSLSTRLSQTQHFSVDCGRTSWSSYHMLLPVLEGQKHLNVHGNFFISISISSKANTEQVPAPSLEIQLIEHNTIFSFVNFFNRMDINLWESTGKAAVMRYDSMQRPTSLHRVVYCNSVRGHVKR